MIVIMVMIMITIIIQYHTYYYFYNCWARFVAEWISCECSFLFPQTMIAVLLYLTSIQQYTLSPPASYSCDHGVKRKGVFVGGAKHKVDFWAGLLGWMLGCNKTGGFVDAYVRSGLAVS